MSPIFLIAGGSSVAGQAALKVFRERYPDARLFATSSRDREVEGAGATIKGIDLNHSTSVERLCEELEKNRISAVDGIVFTPAFGPIGYPIVKTPPEDIKAAMQFSLQPMVELHHRLKSPRTIGFSAFYWLPHALAAYGSMAFVKIAQERLATSGSSFQMIRAGTFESRATRGIAVLLQRSLRDTLHDEIRELGARWKKSGKKFSDFFFEYAFQCEREAFQARFDEPHRATNQSDLERALRRALEEDRPPIVNVIGNWIWTDSAMPELPEDIETLAQQSVLSSFMQS
jgi:hypothetical protein